MSSLAQNPQGEMVDESWRRESIDKVRDVEINLSTSETSNDASDSDTRDGYTSDRRYSVDSDTPTSPPVELEKLSLNPWNTQAVGVLYEEILNTLANDCDFIPKPKQLRDVPELPQTPSFPSLSLKIDSPTSVSRQFTISSLLIVVPAQ